MNSRINEFQLYLQSQNIKSIKRVAYRHLVEFAGDFQNPSIHVTKSRVWMLRQFNHYLTLQGHVPENIAIKLPYPKIEKTVPNFLTADEQQGQVVIGYKVPLTPLNAGYKVVYLFDAKVSI